MGERLIFDVYRGRGEVGPYQICSIHFHWSAYTLSCYQEAKLLIDGLKRYNYNERMSDKETIQILINILQENIHTIPEMVIPGKNGEEPSVIPSHDNRGGIYKDDIQYMKDEGYIFTEDKVHHSYGLLAVSPESIESFHEWAEDIEEFYIDEQFFTNSLFSILTCEELTSMGCGLDINQIGEYNPPIKNVEEVYFEDVDTVINWLKEFRNEWIIGKFYDNDKLFFMSIYT